MKKNYKLFTAGIIAVAVNAVNAQCPIPSLVTASPSTICAGGTTSLNATAAGSSINWFTVPTGGVAVGTSASAANFSISPAITTTYYAESFVSAAPSTTIAYSGAITNYTVPAGVTTLTIVAKGAEGGGHTVYLGGKGAVMSGVFTVTPGQVLKVLVGQKATDVFSGSGAAGGGGGSFVSTILNVPLIVAGGGGGRRNYGTVGVTPNANAVIGTSGVASNDASGAGGTAGNGGLSGEPTGGGTGGPGGGFYTNGGPTGTVGSTPGFAFVNGGAIAAVCSPTTGGVVSPGGFGGGGAGCWCYRGTAGGGGGYSGGGTGVNDEAAGGGGSYNIGTSQVNVGGSNTGNGVVIITPNAIPCTSASRTSVTVTVGSIPTISVTSGAICAGSSYTMVASGAGTYTYTGGSAVVTPTANTSYSVTGTSTLGCVGSNTAVSSVTVNAVSPSVTSSTSNSIICSGESAILTASTAATSYTWNTGATTMSVSVTPTITSTYTVNVSNGTACIATSTVMVTVNACTGINEAIANSVSVYPNPNNGVMYINLTNELIKNSSLEVYDAIGKLVVKQALSNELNTINISSLENGIYTFKVLNNSNLVKIGKLVKQ